MTHRGSCCASADPSVERVASSIELYPRAGTHLRRTLGRCFFAVAVFWTAATANAQAAAKTYRIGWVGHGNAPSIADRNAGDFQQALRDLGYVEGTNFVIEYKYANGNVERLPELATQLVS